MSDWIDELKLQKNREMSRAADEEKAKQRRHDLLRSRLPFFIEQVRTQVRSDVDKLRMVFPEDARYHLQFQEEPGGFKLTNRNSPVFDLEFRLVLDVTQTIPRTIVARHVAHTTTQPKQTELAVKWEDEHRISVEFEGTLYLRPEALGEAITQFVLGAP